MNRTFAAGTALTVLGVVGYDLGVVAPYPGRSFSMTGLMMGLTLLAVADGGTGEADGNGDAGGTPPRDAAADGGITEPMHARDGVDSRGRSVASRRSTGVDHPDDRTPPAGVESPRTFRSRPSLRPTRSPVVPPAGARAGLTPSRCSSPLAASKRLNVMFSLSPVVSRNSSNPGNGPLRLPGGRTTG
jgi:hypothetical protein